ncbi:MAG: peptidoglycan-binding protein [Nitrosomonas sp.]|uniref:peptidoglycan-binding domain-containing protein n=1 Tax=Nitrosomonas sp. TaxID=42353 RepID=UPI0025D3F9DB|nr:peptidoglycan-binding domain-containing protein [Nitrosomonas sp.]MCG7756010.1 peptidoglycan-binding protein [Nitrosomonas sp.]UJP01156.1 MAG: peptidoglycan-binding protein [Nitrosomonas sp.]UJP03832.1 MAG: peptidoglycan-binding protein [Nitrosomonas sp.]
MKSSKISKLVAYTILLLSLGLLFGCKPIFEKKPIPKDNKDAAAAPAAPAAASASAPAAPAAAPAPAPAEPAAKIEDVQSIQSIESAASTQEAQPSAAAAQSVDDGDDVVKVTPAIMRKIQQALASAGFNPGPADGVSGAKTVAAIESFQKQNNIPTGKITKRTLRALGVDF